MLHAHPEWLQDCTWLTQEHLAATPVCSGPGSMWIVLVSAYWPFACEQVDLYTLF